ncbi:MAG: prepilin-type N-terminal cleavage/methylation domain-containing protein [Rhodospirillales bacterium]|nr:prepilin-type N-terminal cleavage/methylation domain-containing protein [Acetobacter sp.]
MDGLRAAGFHRIRSCCKQAFTLVELLVVIAVIAVLLAITKPVFNTIGGANTFPKALTDVSSALEQARAYAISNNTYVFFGIVEVDSSVDSNQTQTAGTGRVAICVAASKDGTANYNSIDPKGTWTSKDGANLSALGKLTHNDNVHLVALADPPANNGKMSQRQKVDPAYQLSKPANDPSADSVTPFAYPIGSAFNRGHYQFNRVIMFDPQGTARIVNANGDSVASVIEIGIEPAHGRSYAAVDANQLTGNFAAIQVDGITGAVRIYRP